MIQGKLSSFVNKVKTGAQAVTKIAGAAYHNAQVNVAKDSYTKVAKAQEIHNKKASAHYGTDQYNMHNSKVKSNESKVKWHQDNLQKRVNNSADFVKKNTK